MNFDEQMMRRCIELARLGLGTTYPNPMVGSVVVHHGEIIGEGWHQKAGGPHAEVRAIHSVVQKELLKDSTIYVSLEPCAHYGKTPPCADLIVQHQIPKVVIGTVDPFAKVNGLGIQKLRNAGIEVEVGVLENESKELNKRFFTFHQLKRPYVILKWAETADGFMATNSGEQKWITNSYSKQLVHKWRTEEQAILVGRHTAQMDNPQLNVRLWSENNPIRLVIDRNLRLDSSLHLFDQSQRTIIFTEKESASQENLEFVQLDFNSNVWEGIFAKLYELDIQSVIVEGGKKTLESLIENGIWDEARIFTSSENWGEGIKSPELNGELIETQKIDTDTLSIYRK